MSKLLSVSLPDDLAAETGELARALGKTRSELVRDALRLHLRRERFVALQQYGRGQAEARGIGPEDVESLIDAARAEGA